MRSHCLTCCLALTAATNDAGRPAPASFVAVGEGFHGRCDDPIPDKRLDFEKWRDKLGRSAGAESNDREATGKEDQEELGPAGAGSGGRSMDADSNRWEATGMTIENAPRGVSTCTGLLGQQKNM